MQGTKNIFKPKKYHLFNLVSLFTLFTILSNPHLVYGKISVYYSRAFLSQINSNYDSYQVKQWVNAMQVYLGTNKDPLVHCYHNLFFISWKEESQL